MPRIRATDYDRKMYQAAWLHFEKGLIQKDVAEALEIHETVVSRLLKRAFERGLAQVVLKPPGLKELEVRLCDAFQLDASFVRVIPSLPRMPKGQAVEEDDLSFFITEELGRAAAEFLGPALRPMSLGLGGGATLAALARHLEAYCNPVDLEIYALSISSEEQFETCASTNAGVATQLLNARFRKHKLPVATIGHAIRLPATGNVKALAAAADTYYEEALENVRLIITGIGDIKTQSPGNRWLMGQLDPRELQAQGIVGDVLYGFFKKGGIPVDYVPSRRVFPFGIHRLQRAVAEDKQVVVVSCGKTEALTHALTPRTDRYITGLVTDENTAQALLEKKH